MLFIYPKWKNNYEKIICAQSTRLGGVSDAPYDSLNMGLSSGDGKNNVIENRNLFFKNIGITAQQITLAKQTHSSNILVTNVSGNFENYDAIITTHPNVFAAVSIADCVPVLLYDAKNNFCAAIHAGWRGTVDNITYKTINQLIALGSEAKNIYAFIGACIGENAFETDSDVANQFAPHLVTINSSKSKFLINLKQANKEQLINAGVLAGNIEVSAYCTYTHNELFFSYRKEQGKTGRMLAIIGVCK